MYPKATVRNYALAAIAVSVFIFIAVVLHELAHALVAKAFNINTVGAGSSWWGAYVELSDESYFAAKPIERSLISLAGPATNLILGLLAAIPVYLMRESLVENSFQCFAAMNLRLAIFNMIPLGGLDGGAVLKGIWQTILPAKAVSTIYVISGVLVCLGIMLLGEVVESWLKKL
jgi:Zn-dependent protease